MGAQVGLSADRSHAGSMQMNHLIHLPVHLSLSHSPGLLLSDAGTYRYPELFLSLGSLWPGWEIEHKEEVGRDHNAGRNKLIFVYMSALISPLT